MAVQVAEIRQSDLKIIHDLQEDIVEKQGRLNNLNEAVKSQLFAKVPIERGRFHVKLVWKKMHAVAWKQVVIERLGQDYAEEVRRAAPAVNRCEVLITEHAIPPLWKKIEESDSESDRPVS